MKGGGLGAGIHGHEGTLIFIGASFFCQLVTSSHCRGPRSVIVIVATTTTYSRITERTTDGVVVGVALAKAASTSFTSTSLTTVTAPFMPPPFMPKLEDGGLPCGEGVGPPSLDARTWWCIVCVIFFHCIWVCWWVGAR